MKASFKPVKRLIKFFICKVSFTLPIRISILVGFVTLMEQCGNGHDATPIKQSSQLKKYKFHQTSGSPAHLSSVLRVSDNKFYCAAQVENDSLKILVSYNRCKSWQLDTALTASNNAFIPHTNWRGPYLTLSPDKKDLELRLIYSESLDFSLDSNLAKKQNFVFHKRICPEGRWLADNDMKNLQLDILFVLRIAGSSYLLNDSGELIVNGSDSEHTHRYVVRKEALHQMIEDGTIYQTKKHLLLDYNVYDSSTGQSTEEFYVFDPKTNAVRHMKLEGSYRKKIRSSSKPVYDSTLNKWYVGAVSARQTISINGLSTAYYRMTIEVDSGVVKVDSVIDDDVLKTKYIKVHHSVFPDPASLNDDPSALLGFKFSYFPTTNLLIKNTPREPPNESIDDDYFEYSYDNGNTWTLVKVGQYYSFNPFQDEDNLYLLNEVNELIGYCTLEAPLPSVTNISCSRFGKAISLSFDLNGIDTANLKIKTLLYNTDLNRSARTHYIDVDSVSSVSFLTNSNVKVVIDVSKLKEKIYDSNNIELSSYITNDSVGLVKEMALFRYRNNFMQDHFTLVLWTLIIITFYSILFLITYLRPLLVLHFYNSILFDALDLIPGTPGKIIKWINSHFFVNVLIANERVLMKWLSVYGPAVRDHFLDKLSVKEREDYVGMTATERTFSNEIVQSLDTSSIKGLSSLLTRHNKGKNIVQIVGVGGSGKSSLAFHLARSLSDHELLSKSDVILKHLIMPVLLEDEASNLFRFVKNEIEYAVKRVYHEEFINVLMKRKKILIVVDALSEKSFPMQLHVKNEILHNVSISLIVITTRIAFSFENRDSSVLLYPEPLSSSTLIPFTLDLLAVKKISIFDSMIAQLQLGTRLSMIFRYRNTEISVTPILVNIAIKPFVALLQNFNKDQSVNRSQLVKKVLSELPSSIPALYSEYVKSVNKPCQNISIPGTELLYMLEFISFKCLSSTFKPTEIDIDMLYSDFNLNHFGFTLADTIAVLNNNGILRTRMIDNASTHVSFILDPLCENFGAFFLAKQNGQNYSPWEASYDNLLLTIDSSRGFAQSLLLIHSNYWKDKNWVDPNLLTNYKKIEQTVFAANGEEMESA